jgi:hypothetical protein
MQESEGTSSSRRTRKKKTPLEQARAWWAKRTLAQRYVCEPGDAPSLAIARVLRQEGLVMEVAGRRAWILVEQKPGERKGVFLANYWPVVTAVLARYKPAVVVGLNGVNLHLGNFTPPERLRVYHDASKSQYAIVLEPGFSCQLQPHALATKRLQMVDGPAGARIPVLGPADLLLTLDEPEIVAGVEQVAAWLRNLVLRNPDLDAAVADNPRPQILQRAADIASQAGNPSLGKQLDTAARRLSSTVVSPARTGVGTRIIVPAVLAAQPRGTATPWLDQQLMRLDRQLAEVTSVISAPKFEQFAASNLIAHARESKAYDAYHSTTMEGYRISPETVEAIVRGEPLPDGPRDQKSLESAMAVQGYSGAFDLALRLAQQRAPITRDVILDLHEELYRPSVDAGIVEASDLRGWRKDPVALAGWMHVPPNYVKVPELMRGLDEFAARTDLDPIQRTLLVHLEFVTIHPFHDGNGRIGRLLGNLSLLSSGLPWVTIRADERMPFFRSIEQAQVFNNTVPFISFIWHLIKQSVSELASKHGRSRRRG